jgi:hypothetical protein
MIWIPMFEMILLYLLHAFKDLALLPGLCLHHMHRVDLIKETKRGMVELKKLHEYRLQVPVSPLP